MLKQWKTPNDLLSNQNFASQTVANIQRDFKQLFNDSPEQAFSVIGGRVTNITTVILSVAGTTYLSDAPIYFAPVAFKRRCVVGIALLIRNKFSTCYRLPPS